VYQACLAGQRDFREIVPPGLLQPTTPAIAPVR
jgi:hypothetical protein